MSASDASAASVNQADAKAELLTPQQLRDWIETDRAVVIDVRAREEYAREHIGGAVSAPEGELDDAAFQAMAGKIIVMQCNTGRRSALACSRVRTTRGVEVRNFEGGIVAWKQAGLVTVENRRVPISIMRQVQITAGLLVVVGVVLGALLSPWFLLLSGFVGAGLTFAGVSGFCGMARLLDRMPWNRF